MVFARLSRLLFGKAETKRVLDERLGELKTVVRRPKPGKWCLWEGEILLEGQHKPTYVSLSGDPAQPYAHLREQMYLVLDRRDSLARAASKEISASIDSFYLSDLGVFDEDDEILQIEFSPVGAPVLASDLRFEWSCDERNHLVVMRVTDGPRIAQGQQIARGLA